VPKTLITSEIELKTVGKQFGYLRVPHSVHESAYGWIPVPITSIKNGDGPVILLLAGVHGDEYEGQIALTKLVRDLSAEEVHGQLIVLTMANYHAAQSGRRTSPVDDGNLNRSFPGDPHGTPTQMIADYIENTLLPGCDYLIDLHSGGASLFYHATLLRGQGHTPDETRQLGQLQEAFDLPYAWIFTSGGGPGSTARTAMGAGNRNGVVSVMAELGGAGTVSPEILAATVRGLERVLISLAMLPGRELDSPRGTREMNAVGTIPVYDNGLFEPRKNIGDAVAEREVVGLIHFPDTPLREPIKVVSNLEGVVLCKRPLGQVQRGDVIYQLARDAVPPQGKS